MTRPDSCVDTRAAGAATGGGGEAVGAAGAGAADGVGGIGGVLASGGLEGCGGLEEIGGVGGVGGAERGADVASANAGMTRLEALSPSSAVTSTTTAPAKTRSRVGPSISNAPTGMRKRATRLATATTPRITRFIKSPFPSTGLRHRLVSYGSRCCEKWCKE